MGKVLKMLPPPFKSEKREYPPASPASRLERKKPKTRPVYVGDGVAPERSKFHSCDCPADTVIGTACATMGPASRAAATVAKRFFFIDPPLIVVTWAVRRA